MKDRLRACSHGEVGDPRWVRSPVLVGLPIFPYNLSFFLPGQPCRVTRLGGVSFLHVNAEGGVG